MTLAPEQPVDAAPTPAAVAPPTVTALVLTRGDPSGLAATLAAVVAQTLAPDVVLVLDRTAGSALDPAQHGAGTDADPQAHTLAAIVRSARERHRVPITVIESDPRLPDRSALHGAITAQGQQGEAPALVWFLPAGTEPEPSALVRLVDAWRRSPSTGLVGPKHVDVQAPDRLRAISIRSTRGGRLLPRPAPGEPDQGQYDTVSDVLAVPLAGSLAERDLVLALRGWETSFGDVGADLDLGWRAQQAGRRVVVVPASRVRSGPGVAVAIADTAARRRSARRVALTRAPWWATPFLAVWIALSSVLAALGLLLLKRPRPAWAELTALSSLDPVRGLRARRRTRGQVEVGRRDLASLFEPRRSVLVGWADSVHHALVPSTLPVGDETVDLDPRSWVVKVVRHPGVVAVLAATAVAVAAGRSLGTEVVTGLGSGLRGGELLGTRADAGALWHAWRDGWSGGGLGGPDPAGPHSALLAGPAWLVSHVPLLPDPGSPAGLVVGLLVLLAMPAAAFSAYLALRVAAARRWVRALGAVAWACSPPAAAAVAQGRLGASVALVLLPGVAAGLWLLAVRRSTGTSAFATALAVTVLGTVAPALAALGVLLALLLVLVRSRVRLHSLVVAAVPAALLAPWVLREGADAVPRLVAGVGLAQWGGGAPTAWRIALLDAGGPGSPEVWLSAPLVVAGVLALARGARWWGPPSVLAALLPLFVALALLAPGVRLGEVPDGFVAAGEPITPWVGTLLLPVVLVLVLALVHALDALALRPAGAGRQLLARGVLALAVSATVAMLAGPVLGTLGQELRPWSDPRPAVSVDQAEGAFATRALFVVPGETGAAYRFVGREDAAVTRGLPVPAPAAAERADDVTALLGAAPGSEALIGATAIDLLAIRGDQVPEVVRRLDATTGLQPISARQGWRLWRLSPPEPSAAALVAPPRLRLDTPTQSRLVETTGSHGATTTSLEVPEDARLVVAEPPSWAEYAVVRVDGTVIEPEAEAPRPTYVLPQGSHRLVVTLRDPDRWWHLGQALALSVLGFLAVPFGRRESRTVA